MYVYVEAAQPELGMESVVSRAPRGRDWLSRQPLPVDEKATIDRHVRELDRLAEDLDVLDREVAQGAIGNPSIERLITITGVNLTVAAGLVAAIGDIRRFTSPQKP